MFIGSLLNEQQSRESFDFRVAFLKPDVIIPFHVYIGENYVGRKNRTDTVFEGPTFSPQVERSGQWQQPQSRLPWALPIRLYINLPHPPTNLVLVAI